MAYIDRLVIFYILVGFGVGPIVIEWALLTSMDWYLIYLAWAVLIGSAYWINKGRDLDDF